MTQELFSLQEIDNKLLEIISGNKVIDFERDILILTQPSGLDKLIAQALYDKEYKQALKEGLYKESEIPSEMMELYFTEEDQSKVDSLNNKIEAYSKMLEKGIKGSSIYNANKEKLKELKDHKTTLELKKSEVKLRSAEFKALEEKYYYLLSKCVLNTSMRPKWSSVEEMYEEKDLFYLENLLYGEFQPFLIGLGTKELRYIARSIAWSNRFYSSMKTGTDLFNRKAEDLSTDQITLMAWSMFYYDISQMTEEYRPPEDIINKDEELDNYLENLNKRLKVERLKGSNSQNYNKNNKISSLDQGDVIVTASNKQYSKLYKQNMYSDTKAITGRVKGSNSNSYSEAAEMRDHRYQVKLKRKQNSRGA